jgi:alpha-N-arabinofuranosidase
VKNGQLTLSVVNLHASLPAEVEIDLRGRSIGEGSIAILTHSDLAAHNTFEYPEELAPNLDPFDSPASRWIQTLPPASVTVLRGKLV